MNNAWSVFADIAPYVPEPTIPGTEVELPSPVLVTIAGLCIVAAVVIAAVVTERKRPGAGRLMSRLATVVGVLAVCSIGYVVWKYADHSVDVQNARKNYRSPGPVRNDISPAD